MIDDITKYSFDKPNKHDDGIDSVWMYASEIILGKGGLSKPKAIQRIFWKKFKVIFQNVKISKN